MSAKSAGQSFLFAFDIAKIPTTRRMHIQRLYDAMQLCIHRNDLPRARRAWAILARCKEFNWMTMWKTAVHILSGDTTRSGASPQNLEFLRAMMLQHPGEREIILKELVLRLIMLGRYGEALEELELYLPAIPYQDNHLLHFYAGLILLFLSQSDVERTIHGQIDEHLFNRNLLRDAQIHFERCKELDPENSLAEAFLQRLPKLSQSSKGSQILAHDSDDSDDLDDNSQPQLKRVRT